MNGRVLHVAEDGTRTDVTEGVQAMYDLVTGSMDWGSGFLSYEDAVPVGAVARLCGFEGIAEVERYLQDALHREESDAWRRTQPTPTQAYVNGNDIPHAHAWSSAGRCMWHYCNVRQ